MIHLFVMKFLKWKYYIITSIILSISVIISSMNSLESVINKAKNTENCHFCYGFTSCHLLDINELTFDHSDLSAIFSNYFGSKNVYFVKRRNKKMVFKQLASDAELQEFDEISFKFRNKNDIDFLTYIKKVVSTDMNDTNSKLRLCPNTKNINLLFQNRLSNNSFSYKIVWTLLKINPEPLILQMLPARLGWPVPVYFGACGRFVVEEYVGPVLSAFHNKLWLERAKIASSLINAAHRFTFQDDAFAYYLTDVSFDNIAVDSKNIAKFIDLEHVIVVDKKTSIADQSPIWKEVHKSDEDFDYENCLIFSPADICAHRISDHNYYTICKNILATKTSESQIEEGFLHDVPTYILNQYPILISLVNQCSKADNLNSRITTGIRLNELLEDITKTLSSNNKM